jgi:hypothetical protein
LFRYFSPPSVVITLLPSLLILFLIFLHFIFLPPYLLLLSLLLSSVSSSFLAPLLPPLLILLLPFLRLLLHSLSFLHFLSCFLYFSFYSSSFPLFNTVTLAILRSGLERDKNSQPKELYRRQWTSVRGDVIQRHKKRTRILFQMAGILCAISCHAVKVRTDEASGSSDWGKGRGILNLLING